ncbi:Na+/H+ antiporter NhaA [Saccharibacter floricola]|nr:Na+/H+ antiporter NhaA [Saccharibacter floricola]
MSVLPCRLYKTLTRPALTGSLLIISALAGIFCASSPLSTFYHVSLTAVPITSFPLSLEGWISQGVMTLFFAALALDIRQDMRPGGPLSRRREATLPLIGALGGMLAPALIAFLCGSLISPRPLLSGWAVPTATDAAFTVPILALIPGLPASLRAFIMALAIFDDLGAILILALFYGHMPHLLWLGLSSAPFLGLLTLSWCGKSALWLSLPLTLFLWFTLFHAGVEPTLAGVVFGLCCPPTTGLRLAHMLAVPVGLVVLPLFALSSTGIDLRLCTASVLLSAPFLGAALGLWLGKPLGISGAVWLATRNKAALPTLRGRALIGLSMVCGIGFTMSLLITSLAYHNPTALMEGRCGVLVGSCLSALTGWIVLRNAFPPNAKTSS